MPVFVLERANRTKPSLEQGLLLCKRWRKVAHSVGVDPDVTSRTIPARATRADVQSAKFSEDFLRPGKHLKRRRA